MAVEPLDWCEQFVLPVVFQYPPFKLCSMAMASNPDTWFELDALDIERAKDFYSAVFQLELEHMSSPELAHWCTSAVKTVPWRKVAWCRPAAWSAARSWRSEHSVSSPW